MKKIALIILASFTFLHSQAIEFEETKFLSALDTETFKRGNIQYDENKMVIHYNKGRVITKIDNNLTIQNSSGKIVATIDLRKKPHLSLYFRLTKALFLKDFKSLEKDFDIDKNGSKYTFKPKGNINKAVKLIELYLDKESVQTIIISFINNDKITIKSL